MRFSVVQPRATIRRPHRVVQRPVFLDVNTSDETDDTIPMLHTTIPSDETVLSWREDAEALFADIVFSSDLFYAPELVIENLGTLRASWRCFDERHIARKLKIWTEAFPAFLGAMEEALADERSFLPRLSFLSLNRFPSSARLPIPRPGQVTGHGSRPLLQRLADVLFEREERGYPAVYVDLSGTREDEDEDEDGEDEDEDEDEDKYQYGENLLLGLAESGIMGEEEEEGLHMRFGLNMYPGLF